MCVKNSVCFLLSLSNYDNKMPTQYKCADRRLRGFVSLADYAQKVAEELLGLGYASYIPREQC